MPNPSEFQRMEEDKKKKGIMQLLVEELESLKKRIKTLEEWRERNTDDGR